MSVQRCPCGNLVEPRATGSGRYRKWCTKQCRDRHHKQRTRTAAAQAKPQKTRTGAAWAQPPKPLQALADNVATELSQGQLLYHIAGLRSLTSGRLAALLTQEGHYETAGRIQ